jgi:hypothetical protein
MSAMGKHLVLSLGVVLVTLGLLPAAAAAQRRPLPSFTVASASGVRVPGRQLSGAPEGVAGRWLLVYVAPDGVTSERLLRSLDEWAATDGARVVVVVAGELPVVSKVRPLLTASAAAVYADPDGSAARALGVTSIPALVGISGGALDWMLQGVLNDPRMVEPVVRSWLGGQP